jgi:hypothetical protein
MNEVMKTINKNQNTICWSSTCAILLLNIQNAAHRICPPFYYERRVSHNDRLLSVLSETTGEKEKCIAMIKKELFIYRFFSKENPQNVIDWNKTATAGEEAYIATSETTVPDTIAEPLLRFISHPETAGYVLIHNSLITTNELQLFELFKHIAIQINYLKD